ncbi:MAG: META domain-containing protein [Pseudomonadota bacterium]
MRALGAALAAMAMMLALPAAASPLAACLASENPRACLELVERAVRGDLEAAGEAVVAAAASLGDVGERDAALLAFAPSAEAFAVYVERECVRRRLMLDAGTGGGQAELACRAELQLARAATLWDEVGGRGEPLELAGRDWRVVRLDGQPVLEGTSPTLTFGEDGRAGGDASTNRWFAGYLVHGFGLAFGAAGSTMMYNDQPPGRMDQERRFLGHLGEVDRFRLVEGRLELLARGRVVVELE